MKFKFTKSQSCKTKHAATLLALAAGLALAPTNGVAQSVDSLLDKLVEKGVLSVKEANDLRDESDKNFNTAISAKLGMPDWVTALKLNGDIRGRYEHFSSENKSFATRDRFRYRLRFGMTAQFMDDFEAGFRLTSSEQTGGSGGNAGAFGGDPISGNTTFADNGSKKFIFIDQVYGRWTPFKGPNLMGGFTIGKMENPFVFSDMVFDPDYTPEGAAAQLAYRFNDRHTARFNGGAFVLDEFSGVQKDPFLFGAQARWDAAWSKKFQTSAGLAWLMINGRENLPNTGVPNINRGNSHVALVTGGTTNLIPAYNFTPIVADVSATYSLDNFPMYPGAFPIRLAADYMINPAAPAAADNNAYSVGVQFGKSGKKKTWDISYTYKWLGANSWWEELVDSDFGAYYAGTQPNSGLGAGYGAGTNAKGHIVRFTYSPADAFTLSMKWFRTDLIVPVPGGSASAMDRVQVDAQWKF